MLVQSPVWLTCGEVIIFLHITDDELSPGFDSLSCCRLRFESLKARDMKNGNKYGFCFFRQTQNYMSTILQIVKQVLLQLFLKTCF